jgi:glutamyl-tRNA synthetase
MTLRVRFAPSPTGRLHVGNIFVALANWLYARSRGGSFLLRLDDTDRERSTAAYAAGIEQDLAWLGLAWDDVRRQSDRGSHYDEAAARLRASGRLYPCFETPEELALKRRSQLQRGLAPVYDRAALALGPRERARLEAEGRRPHWRFLLQREDIAWDDLVRGPQHIDESSQSDPVLVRADGSTLYTLTSVVDDAELGVSHVIRGNDHVTNTAAQIQLFQALGAAPPTFAHLPLLVDAGGEGLSKRTGAQSVADLRAAGLEPLAIAIYLARLGTGEPMEPVADLAALTAGFDLGRFGRASPRFDPAELAHLNARLLHGLSYDAAAPRLAERGLANVGEPLWLAVRGNLARLDDLAAWLAVTSGEVAATGDDPELLRAAAGLLPPEPWDAGTWPAWTKAIGSATGRKGRALFHPLRLALTGRGEGPEMKALLPLIGRDRALARLEAAAA